MKIVLMVLLSFTAATASALGPCRVGASDRLADTVNAIVGGSRLITLERGTPVSFLGVPGGIFPNYEVAVADLASAALVGSTTEFVECRRGQCRAGQLVTLRNGVNAIAGGTRLVPFPAGATVMLTEVPSGFSVNYEIAPVERVLLGATTRFQNCR